MQQIKKLINAELNFTSMLNHKKGSRLQYLCLDDVWSSKTHIQRIY